MQESKDVENVDFWKGRLEEAQKDFHAVYCTSEKHWDYINQVHRTLIDRYIQGKVLDAACGYGRMCHHFNPQDYTGVDLSPDFIEKAKKDAFAYKFMVGDVKNLPFEDNEFDWAFCVSLKRMIEDNCGKEEWKSMEKELLRVAKQLLILEYEDPREYQIL